jgi:hypothetical protein
MLSFRRRTREPAQPPAFLPPSCQIAFLIARARGHPRSPKPALPEPQGESDDKRPAYSEILDILRQPVEFFVPLPHVGAASPTLSPPRRADNPFISANSDFLRRDVSQLLRQPAAAQRAPECGGAELGLLSLSPAPSSL